jgi:hypothetical protein
MKSCCTPEIPLPFDDDADSETDSQNLPAYPIANVPVYYRGSTGPDFTSEQEDEDLLNGTDEDKDVLGDDDQSDVQVVEDDGDNKWESDED